MNWKPFLIQLTLVTVATAILLYVMHRFISALQQDTLLSWISLAGMVGLSFLMFLFGRRAAMSDNKHTFTNVIVGFVIGKMGFCLAVVMAYNELMQPQTKFFLLPFFIIYAVYTMYECYFMIRLGKMQI